MSFEEYPSELKYAQLLEEKIKRQEMQKTIAVVKAVEESFHEGYKVGYEAANEETGEWLEVSVHEDCKDIKDWQSAKCSRCRRYHTTPFLYSLTSYPFCPMCGARMEAKNEKG